MSRVFNPETNPVVGLFVRRALSKGRAEGRAEDRAEGRLATLRTLLEAKFGALPTWAEKRLLTVTARQADTRETSSRAKT